MSMEKVLITGSNGFLGSFLSENLLKKGYKVYCLIRRTSNLRWIKNLDVNFVYGDITDKESLLKNLNGIDYVIHTTGIKRALTAQEYFNVNQTGTLNLLDTIAVGSPNLKRFIYISSLAVCGPNPTNQQLNENCECNPLTYYGKSKLAGEIETKKFMGKLPITILRPPTLYGPRDEDVYLFFKTISTGINPVVYNGKNLVSLCYIDDLVEATYIAMLNEKAIGQTYFISEEKTYSWNEIGTIVSKELKTKTIKIPVPKLVIKTIGMLNENISKITKKPAVLNNDKVKEMLAPYWICSSKKAKVELGWESKFPFEIGAKKTIDWYKKEKWL
jgi:nucleoside-diphosphate-sugar epimerase